MIINEEDLKKVIVARDPKSHKGDFGHALLIGGCYPYHGAIIMAALACVNSGAGLVTVATDKENISSLNTSLPEAMAISIDDSPLLIKYIQKADLILIGPGLAEDSRAQAVFDLTLKHLTADKIVLIDGSALNLLAKKETYMINVRTLILTPHQKEWERLSGLKIDQQNPVNNQKCLQVFPNKTILVAKSHQTKVLRGEDYFELKHGGPYQSIGGMGDTLAGMIAAFALQFPKSTLFEKVACATYLHSKIAEDLSQEHYLVRPTLISHNIPKAMQKICLSNQA
ncbi:NAD(P)H-hydrate dehydratase [Streptococcus didelphis]|uniref:NAD(P)H-hydrate dehydratase n=1 Tax=Streptococcus didelphis TaxID=102886 RepID=UPI00035F9248|nr:NAD(P)H-hydrate dehydratase [Streptococcus didelphis]